MMLKKSGERGPLCLVPDLVEEIMLYTLCACPRKSLQRPYEISIVILIFSYEDTRTQTGHGQSNMASEWLEMRSELSYSASGVWLFNHCFRH